MRFSLREMLLVVTIASLAVPALYFANPWVEALVAGATAVLLAGAAIRSLVCRGIRQAAAVGFVVPALLYGVALATSATHSELGGVSYREMDPYNGRLLTTKSMRYPYEWTTSQRSYYIDSGGKRTKSQPDDYDPYNAGGGGLGFGGIGGGGGPRFVGLPDRDDFMPIAHCLWTLLFGYAGMKYASWVYARREADGSPRE
ncbi:MAG: hypothetical protein AAGF31_04240 [Planctomycetota bacterium]